MASSKYRDKEEKTHKNDPIKVIFQNFGKQKKLFLSHIPGSFSPKIRFLGQKVCSVARGQMDRQTDTKVKTEDTLSGFQYFFFKFSFNLQGVV